MSKRTTLPIMTKYDRAALLARRSRDIAEGAPITVKDPGTTDPLTIAKLELEKGTIPLKIQRIQPDGTIETWSVTELIM